MKAVMEKRAPLAVFGSLIAWFFVQTDGFIQRDIIPYCSMKSAPIFTLALLAYLGEPNFQSKYRTRFALGLLFGGLGDFLLSTNELGFLLGSISFGVGHLFYIAYFAPLLRELSYGITAFCLVYAFFVNQFFIVPYLANSPATMCILSGYSLAICVAAIVAGSLYLNGSCNGLKGKDFRALMTGYALFFLSDTLVLLVHLGYGFPHSQIVVLSTYYASQYLIFDNAVTASSSPILAARIETVAN